MSDNKSNLHSYAPGRAYSIIIIGSKETLPPGTPPGGFPIYYVPDRKKERNQGPGGRGPPSVPPRSTWYKFLEGGPLPPGT